MTGLAKTIAWLPLLMAIAAVLVYPADWPRWAVMWTLAASIFGACKWLSWFGGPRPKTRFGRSVGYWLFWPGLDAAAFCSSELVKPALRSEWIEAATKLLAGGVVIGWVAPRLAAHSTIAAVWCATVGLILVLHFGFFHLLSCWWRARGVGAKPLQIRPTYAATVTEFWGKRWNTAFRDISHRFVFLPLAIRVGPRVAMFLVFVVSGIVHDVVISLPARGGYGLPTIYFLIQAAAVFLERSLLGRRSGLGKGFLGRMFTYLTLIGPLPWLAHSPFMTEVMAPFFRYLGVLSS